MIELQMVVIQWKFNRNSMEIQWKFDSYSVVIYFNYIKSVGK